MIELLRELRVFVGAAGLLFSTRRCCVHDQGFLKEFFIFVRQASCRQGSYAA
jgi:hypothetical protein